MSYLLDTNVISEWVKPKPDPGVIRWLSQVDEDRVFLSVISVAELRHGIEKLALGVRRKKLEAWLMDDLIDRFDNRIIQIDTDIANAWGCIVQQRQSTGRPISSMDAFVAGTALVKDLVVVTRNVADFEETGVMIHNPWLV